MLVGSASLRAGIALVASSVLATGAGAARAAPQTFVALDYEIAPETGGCPDSEAFRANVERQLGYDPFRPAADRRVAIQITRKDPGFDGRIRWTDARGRWVGDRRLSSRHSDCGEIAASLAFSVAVQVQLLATLAPAAPPEPVTPAPTPPAPPSSPPAPAPAAPEVSPTPVERPDVLEAPATPEPAPAARDRRLALFVGLGPSLGLGMAPHPTGLGRMFVSGRLDRLSLEIAVDAALPATRQEVDGSGFSLDRFAAAGAACGHAAAFAGCLTATIGVLRARGVGVDAPASPVGLFSQVGARIAATREFGGRFFAAARVDGFVMLSSWQVTLNDVVAWTTPRVGALIGVDLGARFF
jgi:hypothetical protein